MKRLIYIVFACLYLTACQKVTTTDNILSSDSLYIKADTIYERETPVLTNIQILYGNTPIFCDSITLYEINSEQIMPYNDTAVYFLINESDPISLKSLHVIRCTSKKEVSQKVILGQLIKDIDQDGIIEIVGQELSEVACIDCDSVAFITYSPVLVHKLGDFCELDVTLSKELTTLKYGCFLGEQCVDTFLPAKPIIYNGITLW